MLRSIQLVAGLSITIAGLIAYFSLFQIREGEQVIVTQFGDPIHVIREPGLNYKHFWQEVKYYEKRVLNLDPPLEMIVLSDHKRVLVDSFVRYRILDPLEFFRTVRTEQTLQARLSTIANSVIREVLGTTTLPRILSERRLNLLKRVVRNLNIQAGQFGVEIVDARFRRTDLPDEISERVFARMQSEREREGKEFRAQGEEIALRVRAIADRTVIGIKAEAKRKSEILRGDGEAQRVRTLNEAHGQDAEFFGFYLSMQAYENALGGSSTTLLLSPDIEFFDYFEGPDPFRARPADGSTGTRLPK